MTHSHQDRDVPDIAVNENAVVRLTILELYEHGVVLPCSQQRERQLRMQGASIWDKKDCMQVVCCTQRCSNTIHQASSHVDRDPLGNPVHGHECKQGVMRW